MTFAQPLSQVEGVVDDLPFQQGDVAYFRGVKVVITNIREDGAKFDIQSIAADAEIQAPFAQLFAGTALPDSDLEKGAAVFYRAKEDATSCLSAVVESTNEDTTVNIHVIHESATIERLAIPIDLTDTTMRKEGATVFLQRKNHHKSYDECQIVAVESQTCDVIKSSALKSGVAARVLYAPTGSALEKGAKVRFRLQEISNEFARAILTKVHDDGSCDVTPVSDNDPIEFESAALLPLPLLPLCSDSVAKTTEGTECWCKSEKGTLFLSAIESACEDGSSANIVKTKSDDVADLADLALSISSPLSLELNCKVFYRRDDKGSDYSAAVVSAIREEEVDIIVTIGKAVPFEIFQPPLLPLEAGSIEVGTKVQYQYDDEGTRFYPATVDAVNDDGTYDVIEDGDHEEHPAARIERLFSSGAALGQDSLTVGSEVRYRSLLAGIITHKHDDGESRSMPPILLEIAT